MSDTSEETNPNLEALTNHRFISGKRSGLTGNRRERRAKSFRHQVDFFHFSCAMPKLDDSSVLYNHLFTCAHNVTGTTRISFCP
ncbi:hypothetical protein NECAME_14994 [Necator americanus]|uniref:Uncharacterized protein n=1 Tax=Necator americanus TaxID=51031 RepID=W2SM46_NECAM|nr:hypothetical protein NECAME_14994 [Necator americanus]ETN69941.1 hypothetical protein NECAME_14994 [Necator americanus]